MLKNKNGKNYKYYLCCWSYMEILDQANYADSKAGLIGMSKRLCLEYGKKIYNINCY